MLPTAVIPVRFGPTAMRRLAHMLTTSERSALVSRLFEHVASVLRDAGLEVVAVEGPDLNRDVRAAVRRLRGPVLVVHADLPTLHADDVFALLDVRADVVVARSSDGGTNGLLMRRPIDPAFGPGSAIAHATRARDARLSCRVVDLPGFARDIDDETGLNAYGRAFLRHGP